MSRATQEQRQRRCAHFKYGAITHWGLAFQPVLLCAHFVTSLLQVERLCLTTPVVQARQVWALPFSLAATRRIPKFRSLNLNGQVQKPKFLYWSLFLWVLRCFTSPGTLFTHACKVLGLNQGGSPIRRSPDYRLFVTSPKLIADYYVLHRHLESRHPPYTLTEFPKGILKTTKQLCSRCTSYHE